MQSETAARSRTPDDRAARKPAGVPFWRPAVATDAAAEILAALSHDRHQGGGVRTERCHDALRGMVPGVRPFLTTSGTAALEMAALLLELKAGDEVIMPSWTFTSTANAVALRGATPVFVDVQADTLNINPTEVEAAIGERTRAVFCVHYAGVGCEMEALAALCARHGLALVEDAAQAVGASWNGQPLGGVGELGCFSFHASKNIAVGEGGALLVKDPAHQARAERLWEKGTDRLAYNRGEVASFTWRDLGSSFLPSEMTAAFLAAQLGRVGEFNAARLVAWRRYDELLGRLGDERLRLPRPPQQAAHNAHIYFVRLPDRATRDAVFRRLGAEGIETPPHYQPLHASQAGRHYGRAMGDLPVTLDAAETLIRLPLDAMTSEAEQVHVVERLRDALDAAHVRRIPRALKAL